MSDASEDDERYMAFGLGTDHPNARVAQGVASGRSWNKVEYAWKLDRWSRGMYNSETKELLRVGGSTGARNIVVIVVMDCG